jgi:geranylgeranyl diphosphate synthase type I
MHIFGDWHGNPAGFGAAAAILVGDLCLTWSDEMLRQSGLDPAAQLRARPVFDLMRTEVIAGQYLDVHAQVTADSSLQRASTVARYKSAKYTVERPLLIGAAIAEAGAEIRDAYSGYGLPLGEAFQLRDDILGIFGDPAQTGKPAGDDLRDGKRTYLAAAAFAAADDDALAALRAGFGDPSLDAEGVQRLREVIVSTGALARTEQRIANLTEAALTSLTRVPLAGESAGMLADLARVAIYRSL